jgi:hypothetical protein
VGSESQEGTVINYRTICALVLTVALVSMASSSAVLAAPPANDDFDNATVIPELPFTDSIDTREATTANDDPDCSGQGPTVWYSFTPEENVRVEANTFGSDYDTTLSMYTGTRGDLSQIDCNDDAAGTLQSRVRFDATAGETYYFMVGAWASGPGGNLVFSADIAPPEPPPLVIDVTIDRFGSVKPPTGVVTLQGTITCSRPVSASIFGNAEQRAGRVFIRGFFGTSIDCNGETPWSATFEGENGRFVGGRMEVNVNAFAFDPDTFQFAFDEAMGQVTLRGRAP